jgi:putative sterol carrier protein
LLKNKKERRWKKKMEEKKLYRFPSQEWVDELVKIATSIPELVEIGKSWTYGGIITIMEPDENLNETWKAFFSIDRGVVKEAKIIEDEKQYNPAFTIRAKYSVWKGIVRGELDPIQAFLRGAIKVDGNIGILMQYMAFIRKFIDVLQKVPSYFPDEKGG